MFFVVLLLLALIRPNYAHATDPIRLAKFKAINSSGDWIQIYNSSDDSVDLTGYSVTDTTTTNHKSLGCILAAHSYYQVDFSDYLNNTGDTIFLKNNTTTIDSIQYCNHNCSADTASIDIYRSSCTTYDESSAKWTNLNTEVECPSLTNNSCVLPTPTPTSTPTPIPTSPSLTPTSTPSQTPAPTTNPTATPTKIPDPGLTVDPLPSTLKIGQNYTINFKISDAVVGHDYTVKAFGGANNYGIQTQSGSDWLNNNSAWTSFIKYAAVASSINTSLVIRVNPDQSLGQANVAFKLKDLTNNNDYAQTAIQSVQIIAADPTSGPTATPTLKPTATITPFPTDELLPTDSSMAAESASSDTASVQGVSDINNTNSTPSSAPLKKSSFGKVFPFILIGLGGLLLCLPLIIAKIKK